MLLEVRPILCWGSRAPFQHHGGEEAALFDGIDGLARHLCLGKGRRVCDGHLIEVLEGRKVALDWHGRVPRRRPLHFHALPLCRRELVIFVAEGV